MSDYSEGLPSESLDALPSDTAERASNAAVKDVATDATRRTRLANERTFLAWWRTGLAALAVGLAAGKLVPELSHGVAWPYEVLGTGFVLLGIAMIAYSYVRQQRVEAALASGDYAPLDSRVSLAFTVLGVLLGLATIVVILAESG